MLHVHPTAYRYTGDASPPAPGGMAVIYKDLIASDERTRQVIADVTAALARAGTASSSPTGPPTWRRSPTACEAWATTP